MLSGTLEWGTPSKTSNGLPKSHLKNNKSKKVSHGPLPVATRPTRPSSSSPRAPRRRSRHPDEAPREGLGRRRVLRIARGFPREASARSLISVSREAAFSVSREASARSILRVARGRLVRGPSPPASADPPDSRSRPINAFNHSRDLSRTAAQRHRKTDTTRSHISTIPARTGHGGDYRPLCPNTVTTINRRQRLGQDMAGVTGHCVLPLCPRSTARSRPRHCTLRSRHCTSGPRQYWGPRLPRPPHRSTSLGPDQVSASCIARLRRLMAAATSAPRHSWGSHDAQDLMGRPRRPSTLRMGHSDDHAATGIGHRARTCRPYRHNTA